MDDRERGGHEVCNDCHKLFDPGASDAAQCPECEAKEYSLWCLNHTKAARCTGRETDEEAAH